MRVAFITHSGVLYGANRSLLNLIEGLQPRGVACGVIHPEGEALAAALKARNLPEAALPLQCWIEQQPPAPVAEGWRRVRKLLGRRKRAFLRLAKNLALLPRVLRLLDEWQADVVYTNTSSTPLGAMAARLSGRPHIWHLREFNDLDYGCLYDWGRERSARIIGRATRQIAISRAVADYYRPGGADPVLIYNGIATEAVFDELRGRAAATGNPRPYSFCLVGTIYPKKGQTAAIRALALLKGDFPDARLAIVGNGDQQPLRILAAELGVAGQVEFHGHVADPYEAFLSSDAALMCSESEGMGRVTVEAMSACRPVIGYDNAGTSEIIEEGRTGLLYRGGPEGLAAAMRRFMENPAWAHQLGQNGWEAARRRFTVESYAGNVLRVLQEVTLKTL